jgi:SAM-dependent methyltransferase
MTTNSNDENFDPKVIADFGHEWKKYGYLDDQSEDSLDHQFIAYCKPLDLNQFLNQDSVVADFGAGSGRWTSRLLPYFSKVYAIEPSDGAYEVLQRKFKGDLQVEILKETVGNCSISKESLDLAISLGVLHHIPDTARAIRDIAETIKPSGYFLCYLYYKLEDKPTYYRVMFYVSDIIRKGISKLSPNLKKVVCDFLAFVIYLPLARISRVIKSLGKDNSNFPLHHYADLPFFMLRNDALDRFGTTLEQRFSKMDIEGMLENAGFDLNTLEFSKTEPFWTFSIMKSS